ncbi:MAG: carbon-nitrogen hydrolase family protein [Gammaproteobacteria bacterium]
MNAAAVIQMNSGAAVAVNLRRARHLLQRARAAGACLAVLPENFACMPGSNADRRRAAEVDGTGPIQDFLAATAERLGLWIVGGTVPLHADETRVHAAVLVYDSHGCRVARYDKMHLFDVDLPGQRERYRESAHFVPGDRLVAFDTPLGRLGLAVCYDLRFPEFFRALTLHHGCEVFAVPSAFTATTGRAHWSLLVRARAVENQCFMLAAAQTGEHPDRRETYGHSLIVDPWGETLARLARRPGMAHASLDRTAQHRLRQRFPVLDHVRFSISSYNRQHE